MPCTSFLSLPAELRIEIYNHVYAELTDLTIKLYSVHDTKIEFRRKTSDELRTAHSLNRVCRLVHRETKMQLFQFYRLVKHEISLLTGADKDVFLAFCRAISGDRLVEDDPITRLELPRPPLLLTYLKLNLFIHSAYWPLLEVIQSVFPVLETLELDINAASRTDPCRLKTEFDAFLEELHAWVRQMPGLRHFSLWRVSRLRLVEVRNLRTGKDDEFWKLTFKIYRYDSNRSWPAWSWNAVDGDDGQVFLWFNPWRRR